MTIPPNEQETISKYNTHSRTHTQTHTHCARIQTAGNAFLFWSVIEAATTATTTATTTTTGTAANDAAASLSGRREKGAT